MPDVFVPGKSINQPPPTTVQTNSSPRDPLKKALIPLLEQPLLPLRTLSNYLIHPEGVSFQDQEPDETILLFLRRDKITNLPWILTSILLILFPFLLNWALAYSTNPFAFLTQFQFILTFFYILGIFTYIFINFVNWFYNISLVTNERVIDVDFYNIISKDVSATKINLISDVSFSQAGTAQTIFNYGNVLIQTAAAVDKFQLERVPRPHEVVQIIESLIGESGGPNAI